MSEFLINAYEDMPKGHPVKVYMDENSLIRELIKKINDLNISVQKEEFLELFDKLCKIEKHYARKENQLFPYLEKHGWTSPSQNMWAFHDQIRAEIRDTKKIIEAWDIKLLAQALHRVFGSMEHMIEVEEQRLLPNAFQMVTDEEWQEVSSGDDEIGWMFKEEPERYPEVSEEEYIHPSKDTKKRKLPFDIADRIHLDEGYMLPEQIKLMLKFMPVDLTYVDENDRVVFYNRGEDRVFPRSAGIIGREVKFCHPPKSVDMVLEILREFKAGRKNEAEFWIEFKEKFIHIQYFAIRDDEGTYKGVIEMSQDVTHVRNLKGQKRLLEWE
jgi:hypothetical protein